MNTYISNLSYFLFLCIILLIAFYLFKRQKEKKYQDTLKQYLSSILSLNISHLHDSANFFALIKNSLKESDNRDTYNFAKGASYHFRSLFEELKNSQELFENSEIRTLIKNQLNILYKKEAIDLKDLLELELFQLSNQSRLVVNDSSGTEHALTYGNFNLISKALLNLLENAIKHTDGKIKLELHDNGHSWELKISSFGKGIPEPIAEEINNPKTFKQYSGHGLSSMSDIMDFHDAVIKIDTLAGEGACIRLYFEKFSKTNPELQLKAKASPSSKSSFQFNWLPQTVLISSLVLILSSSTLIISYNKKQCTNFFQEKISRIIDLENDANYIARQDTSVATLNKLKKSIEGLTSTNQEKVDQAIQEITKVKTGFLKNFSGANYNLSALIIYNFLKEHAYIAFDSFLEKEAMELLPLYPDSAYLNYIASSYYKNRKRQDKAAYHSLRSLLAQAEAKFYSNPELYTARKVQNQFKDIDKLSGLLASLYNSEQIIEQELEAIEMIENTDETKIKSDMPDYKELEDQAPKKEEKEQVVESSVNGDTADQELEEAVEVPLTKEINHKEQEFEELRLMDQMIEKQDQELGIDFDL